MYVYTGTVEDKYTNIAYTHPHMRMLTKEIVEEMVMERLPLTDTRFQKSSFTVDVGESARLSA